MYDGVYAMIKGIEKNQFAGANYNVLATLALCGFSFFIHVYPFVGLFFGPEWARVLCGFSIIILFTIYNYAKKYINLSLVYVFCLLYTSPSPRDGLLSRMPSSA